MTIHDWSRVESGLFHEFHQSWSVRIKDALNAGRMPHGYFAIVEAKVHGFELNSYARRANRVVVRQTLGRVAAVLDIVSPGNKDGRAALDAFVEKAAAFLRAGVHLLVADLFPPTPRDPFGIHKAIFDQFDDQAFAPPPGKPLTFVSYRAGQQITAAIEPRGVGDPVPDLAVDLDADTFVTVPLAATYAATWEAWPEPVRELAVPKPRRARS